MGLSDEERTAQVLLAHAEALEPTGRERELLYALDAAARALASYDEELVREVVRSREERAVRAQAGAFGPSGGYRGRGRDLRQPLPLKSERQRILERGKRDAKAAAMACINSLAMGRMYSESQVMRIAVTDGSIDRVALFRPAQRAIGRADVEDALCRVENDYARRAFWLRFKWGMDNERVAQSLGCQPDDVNRLVNIALDTALARLNEPVVAEVRSSFMNFCLTHGLEFPEYRALRRRDGKK